MSAVVFREQHAVPKADGGWRGRLDMPLVLITLTLVALGLVMVASASMPMADRLTGNPFYYFERQMVFALLGLVAAWLALFVPMRVLERTGFLFMASALVLLVLVLIPGVGKTVNGSARWIDLKVFQIQVSEPARLALLIYLSGYLVRYSESLAVNPLVALRAILVLVVAGILMLLEPDFGATAVLMVAALAMIFVAGARWTTFVALLLACAVAMAGLIWYSPYRWARFTGFLNPWSDPFNTGFQLTQSLMAIGSGHWFGLGLGESVQKMFYLPEAHTDFLFAILAEELGLFASIAVVLLYAGLVWRALIIADRAAAGGRWFSAYLSFGIGIWIGVQAFVNIGVNMGVLPTKGLTLPLMSYGGSSLLVMCAMVGLLLRAELENRLPRLREEDSA
ncbi:MAG: putative lipid II flippase FtsW [Pseudomonadota bacterium]|nr:putative lipid II flippase FtsW [Pseudomonadota bacterium]